MKRLLCLFLALASPAASETPDERLDRQCRLGWEELTSIPDRLPLSGRYAGLEDGWCKFVDLSLVTNGYAPDYAIDSLWLKGDALGYFTLDEALDPVLELDIRASGLRLVVQVDRPQLDWLYRAQSRANLISVDMSAAWDTSTRILTLSQLDVDFPGQNRVKATMSVTQVDLTSAAAIEMSALGFAVTDATLEVTSHGLFENYLLIAMGAALLPSEGDIDAAAEAMRADALGVVASLPEATFPAGTKAALSGLITALPNPSGTLTMDFRAPTGFGPARFARFAITGVPVNMAEIARLFQGVRVTADWTPEETAD